MGHQRLVGAATGVPLASSRRLLLLLLVLLLVRLRATSAGGAVDEGAIMRQLRQAVHQQGPEWAARLRGWAPNEPGPPCSWSDVLCNDAGHVTEIGLWATTPDALQSPPPSQHSPPPPPASSSSSSSNNSRGGCAPGVSASGPLLPELAQLPWLEVLAVGHPTMLLQGGIPAAWGAHGAFPRLERLQLSFPDLTHCVLPDIHPGALPRLIHLDLRFMSLHATLPGSWGSSPDVLPALRVLMLHVASVAPLPGQWSSGFTQLIILDIQSGVGAEAATTGGTHGGGTAANLAQPSGALLPAQATVAQSVAAPYPPPLPPPLVHPMAPTAGTAAAVRLPAEWASGFLRLEDLSLSGLGIQGSLPPSWSDGAFPALQHLKLPFNQLTGSLPRQLFTDYPRLTAIQLGFNRFSGPLPDAWAAAQVTSVGLEHNLLTGPAFPPAWLQPGAMGRLQFLHLSSNPNLVGTLPADLSWPAIIEILLEATGVEGSIPPSWCHAPFARSLYVLHITGTAVVPTMPPCAAIDMPLLAKQLTVMPQQQQQARQQQRLAASVLAALMPLVAIGAAAAVVRTVWRHGMRRRAALDRGSRDAQSLLEANDQQQQQESAAGARPAAEVVLQARAGAGGMGTRSRRARLAALLVGGDSDGGDTSGSGIEMLPLGELPAPLVHRLRSFGKAGQGLLGLPVGGVAGGLQGSCTVAGSGSPPASRQWGLATQSLRLGPDELQILVDDADGCARCLGEGSSAVVYLALLHGVQVAVKVFELEGGVDCEAIWREVSLMQRSTHQRIVSLYGVALKGSVLAVVMQYMQGGSLRAALRRPGMRDELRWENRGRQVALDVAEALAYMHIRLNLLHGDLKTSNVLLSHDCRACVSDLGLAQTMASCSCANLGFTLAYAAPEQLMGQRCTLAADLYSFGVVLMELATQQVVSSRGEWRLPHAPHECPQGVVDLIQDCLRPDPTSRPTAAQALQRLQEAGSRHGRRSPSFSAG